MSEPQNAGDSERADRGKTALGAPAIGTALDFELAAAYGPGRGAGRQAAVRLDILLIRRRRAYCPRPPDAIWRCWFSS